MNNLHIKFDDANCFKYGNLVIKFKGLVFYKNYLCGVDSLKHFFYDYSKYIDNVKYLRGNFVLCICDKSNTYVFTDNSGISCSYSVYSNVLPLNVSRISTSSPKTLPIRDVANINLLPLLKTSE